MLQFFLLSPSSDKGEHDCHPGILARRTHLPPTSLPLPPSSQHQNEEGLEWEDVRREIPSWRGREGGEGKLCRTSRVGMGAAALKRGHIDCRRGGWSGSEGGGEGKRGIARPFGFENKNKN